MNSLAVLEYEKLLMLFGRYAQTPMGFARLMALKPIQDRLALKKDLDLIAETIFLNEEKQVSWNFSGLADPSEAISILRIKGSTLEPSRMLELAGLCSQAVFARGIIAAEKEFVGRLWALIENLPPNLLQITEKIKKKFLPSGELDDSASPELGRIRRELNAQRGRLKKTLEALMRRSGEAIQDEIVTVRNERFVVPVKADFRGKVTGVAHGFSSSGATVFIEPLDAIEANNELASLKEKEEREIARILFGLSEELREQLPALESAVESVSELDFIKAKVEFARSFKAVVPKISEEETLELIEARHPLLEENLRNGGMADAGVVANSFKLTKEKSVMIISGANAGGKTVVLKTAGLLSLMAVSGLPVPASSAEVPFYKSVLADIGDNQSISANLSTFTSHISNIAGMLQNPVSPALILLDEVGTGTDPEEGSALGVAIVDKFRQNHAQVIASTHYRGLKIYATSDENVINASVEFDEKTLKPTYRLLQGFAGASSGIEIARRFGIPQNVIEAAKATLEDASRRATEYLLKIKRESEIAEDLRAALEEERETVAKKYTLLDIEAGKKERERQKEFQAKLSETIDDFERRAKALVGNLEDKALKARLEKELLRQKAELKRAAFDEVGTPAGQAFSKQPHEKMLKTDERAIAVGMRVLTSFGNAGVVEKIDGGIAEVMIGSMRLRDKVKNLKAIAGEDAPKAGKLEKLQKQAAESNLKIDVEYGNTELNLIGKTTMQAEDEIDRFLDESYLSGMQNIRIIHGIGTGILRGFTHDFLRNHPHVSKYALAPREQGGDGATIVELKQ